MMEIRSIASFEWWMVEVYCIEKLKLLTSKIKSIIAITKIEKRIEQRAQLTQWYKYLNYTARAIHTGWPVVTSTTKGVY